MVLDTPAKHLASASTVAPYSENFLPIFHICSGVFGGSIGTATSPHRRTTCVLPSVGATHLQGFIYR